MPGIRTLDQLIADLDTRQREDPRSRNKVISKYQSVADTVGLSSDAVTTTVTTTPYLWANLVGSTGRSVAGNMSSWG